VPKSQSCSIGPSNWLPPNRSSPPCLVRSQLSSAATHVSKGTSTICQNDNDSGTGIMLVLTPSAPPAPRGAWFLLGPLGTLSGSPHAPQVRRKAPATAWDERLIFGLPRWLSRCQPQAADLSRLSPGQDGRSHHGHSAGPVATGYLEGRFRQGINLASA